MIPAIITVALVLAAIRVAVGFVPLQPGGHASHSFQAIAHLFVGGLFVASMYEKQSIRGVFWWTAIGLTAVESVMFLWGIFGGHH